MYAFNMRSERLQRLLQPCEVIRVPIESNPATSHQPQLPPNVESFLFPASRAVHAEITDYLKQSGGSN